MSVLTKHEPLVGTGLAALPSVNLLPPEIEERKRFRRIQYGLGAGVLSAVGVVALLFVAANASVASAGEELEVVTADGARLQAETATYAEVTAVYAQAAAAEGMLTEAMGEEVRYSAFLSSLSLSLPENVWIKDLSFTQTATPAVVGSTEPGIGTVTVSGTGFSHEDVALWLESLAGQEGYANPYFSSSTEVLLGARTAIDFTSTAELTSDAYSREYTAPAGG